jgi:hypothetical protein
MDIDSMIEVLRAAKRGEQIEKQDACGHWSECINPKFSFPISHYRIAPKKEMTLVEELRKYYDQHKAPVYKEAADRIEELEKSIYNPSVWHTDELLAELKRRTT